MAKSNLKTAKEEKCDEFYTQMEDIAYELKHYKSEFKGKVILCNCDDPFESNFFKYFAINFNFFELKKLIATCYDGSPVAYTQLSLFDDKENNDVREAYVVEIDKVTDLNNDGVIDLFDIEILLKQPGVVKKLSGNGDFRSKEAIEYLKKTDIVVTNPPFSLFREFLAQLEEYNKKYIIMGNTNALGYRETFKLFKEDKIRTGYTHFNTGMYFIVPDYFKKFHHLNEEGKKVVRVSTSCWFTNLPVEKHKEILTLYKKYNPSENPKYYNYDAINVDTYKDIPCDYNGVMGVPITFLDKYNPQQFELLGLGISNSGLECGVRPYNLEHKKYRKEIQKKGAVDGDLYFIDEEGHPKVPYSRILIRKKEF